MQIESFVTQLTFRLGKPLPGEDAQFLMAPASRDRMVSQEFAKNTPGISAVLVLLYPENGSLMIVLIQRSVYEGVHSGQIAFPGGKYQEGDVNTAATALREAKEETGLDPESVKMIGKLSDIYIAPSNFIVTPYIGYTDAAPDFRIDPYEVSRLLCVDFFQLTERTCRLEKMIVYNNGMKIKSPYFDVEGFTVWGATAMIISELKVVVAESKIISF